MLITIGNVMRHLDLNTATRQESNEPELTVFHWPKLNITLEIGPLEAGFLATALEQYHQDRTRPHQTRA